jgi:hypothetical protein
LFDFDKREREREREIKRGEQLKRVWRMRKSREGNVR